MTPQGPIPNDSQLDTACEWFARLRGPEPDADVLQAFAAWLAEDAAHRPAFDATASLFEDPALDQLPLHAVDIPRAQAVPVDRDHRTPRTRRWWPLAAVVAVTAIALSLLWSSDDTRAYRSATGDQLAVRLDDGSQLTLNTDSEVEVNLSANRRAITVVRGEAWFDVAPAPKRPFVVAVDGVTVTATGTAFSVQQRADVTLVNLAQGEVLVAAAAASTSLKPGQRAAINAAGYIEVSEVDTGAMGTWRRQMLVYEGVSLAELVADLNRYMPANMEIADPALAATEVSAILRIADQATMLEALTRSLALRWESVDRDHILLYPAADEAS